MGIPMLKIRRSRLIFNMGIPILVRRHLYIETPHPRIFMDHYLHVKWYCWQIAQGWIWYYLRLKMNTVQWVRYQCLQSNIVWLKYLLSNPSCTFNQMIWEKHIKDSSPMVTKNSQAVHQVIYVKIFHQSLHIATMWSENDSIHHWIWTKMNLCYPLFFKKVPDHTLMTK